VHGPSGEELLGERDFAILNAVYLKKMATPEHVAEVTGIPLGDVAHVLTDAAGDGSLIDLGGQFMLGEDGRARVLAFYAREYANARTTGAVSAWYDRFETVNAQFIGLVSEWQKTDGDERVQERLVRLVERHVAALRVLAQEIPRYERYAARFERGLTNIDRGRREYVCTPAIDSVHNVWFEFHEDILAVVGRPRET
jgi:hypothetical protein